MAPKLECPDLHNLVEEYVAGKSVNQLANERRVSRNVVERWLKSAGIALRGQSESEATKWSRMTSAQRLAQVAAAHDAVRGTVVPFERKLRVAATNAANLRLIGKWERELAEAIGDRAVLQRAEGPYNIDISIGSGRIAVEVVWGGGSPRRWAGHRKRVEYLIDRGWLVLMLDLRPDCKRRRAPDVAALAQYLIALADRRCRNKPPSGGYGVILRDAQPSPGTSLDLDGITRVV